MLKCKLFALLLLSLMVCPVCSQTYFSKEEVTADLDALYAVIYEVHPNMFTVITQEAFEANLAEAKGAVKDSMTVEEFFPIVAPLVSSLNDGHTNIQPSGQIMKQNPLIFPFNLNVDSKDSTAVVRNAFLNDVPIGAKVLSVNGISMNEIVRNLATYVSAEGFGYKAVLLRGNFWLYYYFFDHTSKEFEIAYEHNGKSYKETVSAVSLGNLIEEAKKHKQSKPQTGTKALSLSVDEKRHTAVIDFRSFTSDFDYVHHFLDSTFTVLKEENIHNLIIDIRNNEGGNSHTGDMFFQYISHTPFKQFGKTIIKVNETIKAQRGYQDVEDGITVWDDNTLIELSDNPLRFKGDVYLLTSGSTFSSATNFAWAFQHFDMGTIIGEETGGYIVAFGDVISYRLPNTKLGGVISHKEFYGYGATEKNRHGVIPDIEVPAGEALDKALSVVSAQVD